MKVTNNKVNPSAGRLETGKTGRADAGKGLLGNEAASANATKSAKNNVNVSERAQMMQKAKDIAAQPFSVDEAKVARLQKLIDEGRYKVDADKIADRLVDEHLGMSEIPE